MATIKEGITVKSEKTDIYFKLVCDPFLFFFSSVVKSVKVFKYKTKKN